MTTPATLVRIETRDLRQATPGRPSRPIHGDTTYLTLESFSAQHGQLSSGVWEATAGAFRSHCAGYVEFCHIVEGSCRVVDPDGTPPQLRGRGQLRAARRFCRPLGGGRAREKGVLHRPNHRLIPPCDPPTRSAWWKKSL